MKPGAMALHRIFLEPSSSATDFKLPGFYPVLDGNPTTEGPKLEPGEIRLEEHPEEKEPINSDTIAPPNAPQKSYLEQLNELDAELKKLNKRIVADQSFLPWLQWALFNLKEESKPPKERHPLTGAYVVAGTYNQKGVEAEIDYLEGNKLNFQIKRTELEILIKQKSLSNTETEESQTIDAIAERWNIKKEPNTTSTSPYDSDTGFDPKDFDPVLSVESEKAPSKKPELFSLTLLPNNGSAGKDVSAEKPNP